MSDLDFTLLRSDGTVGPRTATVVNDLIEAGGLFTYATARSYTRSAPVTSELRLNLPVITYGGAVIIDPCTGTPLSTTFLAAGTVTEILRVTSGAGAPQPILFAITGGRDRVLWRSSNENACVRSFLDRRVGDPRLLPVADWSGVDPAQVLSASMGGSPEALRGVRSTLGTALDGCFTTLGRNDYQPDHHWLDISPAGATKAAAVRWLRAEVGAERVVAFGDNLNDVPMLAEADVGYAVANAMPELRAVAFGVIGGNDDEGIAAWLSEFGLTGGTLS